MSTITAAAAAQLCSVSLSANFSLSRSPGLTMIHSLISQYSYSYNWNNSRKLLLLFKLVPKQLHNFSFQRHFCQFYSGSLYDFILCCCMSQGLNRYKTTIFTYFSEVALIAFASLFQIISFLHITNHF